MLWGRVINGAQLVTAVQEMCIRAGPRPSDNTQEWTSDRHPATSSGVADMQDTRRAAAAAAAVSMSVLSDALDIAVRPRARSLGMVDIVSFGYSLVVVRTETISVSFYSLVVRWISTVGEPNPLSGLPLQ